ncbi:PolB DNA polymerase elongation subunit (family B) [uncultured Caudovirales phage]|uniref:DNA polymerase n=1 Tax=uncultured Caudovirales phage TaxID=2100421 RepID=A0A6J5NZE4_9CAUD|nr:PolB DNA polymerase elongation subunit (family B) [uncultured Caudovirales phage]
MSKFYTNVLQRGDKIYVRGFELGMRYTDIVNYNPYLFVKNKNGKYKTLANEPVDKIEFDSIRNAKDFVENYKDVSNMELFGLTNYNYTYIFDNFKNDIDYDPAKVNIGTIDIECAADEGFPNIEKADKEITAVTVRSRNRNYVFGCGDFVTNDPNTHYFKCKDEYMLLHKFIDCWVALDFDIVTGWNIEFFDIPYLINRIKNLFNEKEAKRLSPWKILNAKSIEFRGKENQSYDIFGISILDYYQLYRKFTFGNQESYKLDYISQIELGEKKIDYSEYGDLLSLYKNNFQKFIEYNIHDCVLVDKLEDKLKFLEQVMAIAYDARINYNDTLTTVRSWDVIIHNYLLEQGIVIPQFKKNNDMEPLVGGHVKDVKPGLYKWVVSFDLNSLYPHLIMQYNISPEMFAGRSANFPSIDYLLTGKFDMRDEDPNLSYAHTANGCAYRKDKQGFLAALMEKMYNDRTKYKKLMIEAKKSYEKTKSYEDLKLVARYNNIQMAKKIQLNSAYGALANIWFRWFNFNHAEAITTSGQLSIRWIEKKINEYMNKMLKTDNMDYVIASDTDSIYVTMEKMVELLNTDDEMVIVGAIDNFCEKRIQPYIDKCYQELADMMNAYQQKMQMKRETIANKGIWKAKKMYILNAWNIEGVQYEKPKLKIQGIEAVRSSTPHACRENIKKALDIIMNSNQSQLQKFIADFKLEFDKLPFEQVAFPRGVKGLSEYSDRSSIYKKGTPIQTKGSLIFNHLLKTKGIKTIPEIQDGDKIKFAYLKVPNPIQETVIATPDELPSDLGLDKYIDRDIQFQKAFLEPIKSIADVVGWNVEERSTLEEFF